jgi:hypothetical protein
MNYKDKTAFILEQVKSLQASNMKIRQIRLPVAERFKFRWADFEPFKVKFDKEVPSGKFAIDIDIDD